LLDVSALSGETARRWAEIAATRAALFRAHHELSDVVEQAARARTRDLQALLDGPSVVRSDVTRPLAERGLLDGSRRVERCSPEQLLAEMDVAFADVRVVIATVQAAWSDAIAWTARSRTRIDELRADAGALDQQLPAVLDALAREVDAVAEAALADPLGGTSAPAAGIDVRLAGAEEALASARAVRDDWTGQLAAARRLLADLSTTIAASDAVAARAGAGIAGVSPEPGADPSDDLAGRLDAIAATAGAIGWSDLGAALADWRRHVQAASDVAAARAAALQTSLDERDELRARLDAYEAKAATLGLLEDPELGDRHRRAHDALYTAPTDLAGAALLVEQYRDQLRGRARR
jgi:hypothetical protein